MLGLKVDDAKKEKTKHNEAASQSANWIVLISESAEPNKDETRNKNQIRMIETIEL